MKKLILFAAVVVMTCSCNHQRSYTIEGTLTGLEGTVFLLDETGTATDSTMTKNGRFMLSGDAKQPTIAYLSDGMRPFALIFIEPGEITVTGDMNETKQVSVSGTPANDAYTDFSQQRLQRIDRFYDDKLSDAERAEIIRQDSVAIAQAFEANLDNYFGAYLLAQELAYNLPASQLLEAIDRLAPAYQQTEMIVQVKERAQKMLKSEIGQPYINLAIPDLQGDTIRLSTVIGPGRYVLLDFWASWCGPCMQEVPYLVEAYKTYHPAGFEIFGVSLDADGAKWRKAVETNNMEWIQTSDLQGWSSPAAQIYAVNSIPANYLIAPDGTIVARNLRGEELAKKLAEIFPQQ